MDAVTEPLRASTAATPRRESGASRGRELSRARVRRRVVASERSPFARRDARRCLSTVAGGMDPRAPAGFSGRAEDARERRTDTKRHEDVSCNLEYYGAERVWVSTTGLATEDFPWPALVVPEPRRYFLPAGFHAPKNAAETHVAVMLLGVGDTRRHSELQWFRHARAKRVAPFSAEGGDPLVAADGLDAAFRTVDACPIRKDACPKVDPGIAAAARARRLGFLGVARWGVCLGGCWLAESPFAFPEDYAGSASDAEGVELEAAFEVAETTGTRRVRSSADVVGTRFASRTVSAADAETGKALALEALLEAAAAARGGNRRESAHRAKRNTLV